MEPSGLKLTDVDFKLNTVRVALAYGTRFHVVQKMPSHKRIEITLGIHGHVLPDRGGRRKKGSTI